uniref:Uncharacterized protein n=1 Tax=Sparus aurata TaxID=8175 RepID=A0A671VAI4_SPAAU
MQRRPIEVLCKQTDKNKMKLCCRSYGRWTESETQKLKEGVRKFGEGNWSKIKSYYSFENRTNINLKDRWRTLKKSKMV